MDIKTYVLSQKGGTCVRGCPILARIAKRATCSADTLYMIALGHKRASAAFAIRLEHATRGAIRREDLRPDLYAPRKVQRRRRVIT